MQDIFLSQEGYHKLLGELEYLKKTKRREISKRIGHARELGDISENAEYDAAKEEQGLCEKRIADLEEKLSRARIIENENIPQDKAFIGATVKLKDLDSNEECEYTLVSELEADYNQGKISVTSPIGKGLLGRASGETVEINIPAGLLRYKILNITR